MFIGNLPIATINVFSPSTVARSENRNTFFFFFVRDYNGVADSSHTFRLGKQPRMACAQCSGVV